MFYDQLKERFLALAIKHSLLQEPVAISARILSNEEAIGNPTRQDYPLLKGKEFLMAARFKDSQGQAFTDAPSEQISTLEAILDRPFDSVSNRAIFIATLNAVMRSLQPEIMTIHCHDDEPEDCAREMMRRIKQMSIKKVGLVGLQPAILEALVETFGADHVICVDRDESQLGSSKYGVSIKWGDEQETADLFVKSDLVLATGSTVVNGSLPGLLQLAKDAQTEIIFYGTSIAGAAELMNLKRFCFKAV
ncbi:Rossmann-like domain-containing protein [uncultured Desulfuromusa sp.]|uniref:Rossmann-like domain-containing protein n=1 Tax=uncultured Desulfuromusa sp. TaxID=219183 RepID=UPI002AA6C371|nr:DUF364 domain-containing protein [uncultured Desulfuromusa sp.]